MKAYAERGKMTNCDACVNYEYDEDYAVSYTHLDHEADPAGKGGDRGGFPR